MRYTHTPSNLVTIIVGKQLCYLGECKIDSKLINCSPLVRSDERWIKLTLKEEM